MNPLRTLGDAVTLPLKAVFVVGICFVINVTASPGEWWVQWVALGMGIAVLCAWWRAARLVIAAVVLVAIGNWAYRRWGDEGRRRVQGWLAPDAAGRGS